MRIALFIILMLALINPVISLGGRRPQPVEHDKGFQHIVEQEDVSEKVEVKWWVLPLFAVDGSDHSIGDLVKGDIALMMDDYKVEDFILYRRDFNVSERAAGSGVKEQAVEKHPVIEKDKIVFLLFDTVLNTTESVQKAKIIAKNIVADSAANNRFVIFTIDPISGLNYHAGPLKDKRKVSNVIEKKVKGKYNKRSYSVNEVISFIGGGKGGRLTPEEAAFLMQSATKLLKGRSNSFFRSFAAFYYNLNSIKDNKFIYLFTEGVSRYQEILEDGHFYKWYFKQVAEYLGRCGSVLFVINSGGIEDPMPYGRESGKDSLLYLARESGGKYIQGSKENISRRINNFHRAYYEIAFADPAGIKGNIHNIKVKSKRKGVNIHTLGTVERAKKYNEMNEIEQEILVLNLISQNPLYETKIKSKGVQVLKLSKEKGKTTYKISIPADYLHKKIDLYKVMVDEKSSETKMEKETIFPRKNKLTVQFAAKENSENNFVLLNESSGTALIEGPGIYDELETLTPVKKGKALSDDPKYRKEMLRLLEGAAQYCENLKQAAFHCFCKEKVAETFSYIKSRGHFGQNMPVSDISLSENRATTADIMRRNAASTNSNFWKMIRKYVFDYQVVSSKGKIKEQRKLISKSSPELKIRNDRVTRMIYSFLAQRIMFGPLTLLAEEQQNKYDYRLLCFEKHKDRHYAVIEAMPKKKKDVSRIFGKVWVDTEDFSVRKIQLDPKAIQGYKSLLKHARKLRTRLYLDCDIEYDEINDGIRFPTRFTISEKYKGGPNLIGAIGNKTWERNRKNITYTDYKFFDVQTEVKSTKMER